MLAPGSEWHPLGRERCGLQTDTALSGKRMETDGETPDSQPVQGFCAFRGRLPLGRGETDMETRSPQDFPTSGGRLSRRLHALAASASVPAGVGGWWVQV